jgi:putative redox protein
MSGKPPAIVSMQWVGGHAFEGGREGSPTITLDGKGVKGPSPVDALLLALAGCTGYDIVDILEKRRTPVQSMKIDVVGERVNAVPARVTKIVMTYDIGGDGIEQVHAERAVELAVQKYCSVRDSLDPNMPIETVVRVHNSPPAETTV